MNQCFPRTGRPSNSSVLPNRGGFVCDDIRAEQDPMRRHARGPTPRMDERLLDAAVSAGKRSGFGAAARELADGLRGIL
jgi:hypothetical protein